MHHSLGILILWWRGYWVAYLGPGTLSPVGSQDHFSIIVGSSHISMGGTLLMVHTNVYKLYITG